MSIYSEELKKTICSLNALVMGSRALMEGNLFYHHHQRFRVHGEHYFKPFENKRQQIVRVTSGAKHVLEIGFNAGHSAALLMHNHPDMRYSAIDICHHTYTKPCANRIKEEFGDRFSFYEGDSAKAFPEFNEHFMDCDLVHIDGGHSAEMFLIDAMNAINLPRNPDVVRHILIDDVDLPEVHVELGRLISEGLIERVQMEGFDEQYHILCKVK